MIGQTIAHYRVTAKLGAGGMGEVYRATDSKLGRDVALKVLPNAFVQDAQRMQRFQREAQVLASLNHPNIAAIHALEHQDKIQTLVMELVEGPTLAERIARGAIPLEEALPIAKQIAEALEYAHERGIIHRDLKPANIKVTPAGQVKVLDFGLAKALGDDTAAQNVSNSPTLSLAATKAGVILGTAAYMSPEQARGRVVDRRTDIWSFGVVLFEMLTGHRAFPGEDASETLASVIKEQPDWNLLPVGTPLRVRELLRRCLAKVPQQRLQAIGDARLEIEETPASTVEEREQAAVPLISGRRSRRANFLVPTLVFAAVALGTTLAWVLKPAPKSPPVVRVAQSLPTGSIANSPALDIQNLVAISPDGTKTVLATTRGLLLRSFDSLETTVVPETVGATEPVFSFDSRWIGFVMGGHLKKMPVTGGSPTTICSIAGVTGGLTWGPDNSILIGGAFTGILRVGPEGGSPTVLVQPEPGIYYAQPQALPDGKTFLFVRGVISGIGSQTGEVVIQTIGKDDATMVLSGVRGGAHLSGGQLIYLRESGLFAVAFDPKARRIEGEPEALAQNAGVSTGLSISHYAVSHTGTLVYVETQSTGSRLRLVNVDRSGKVSVLPLEVRGYSDPRVSPDGRLVAAHVQTEQNDVWVANTDRGVISRLSFDPGEDETPAWSPDGRWVAWAATRAGTVRAIFRRPTDGSGAEELLWKTENHTHLRDWLADGKTMVVESVSPSSGTDILRLELGEKVTATIFLQTPFNERNSRVSPDGRWIAYTSDESGRDEVYVQSFPEPGMKLQASVGGASEPVWSRDGRSIFFRGEGSVQEVSFQANTQPVAGKPLPLFSDKFESPQGGGHTGYDTRPGGGFLMIQSAESKNTSNPAESQMVFVFNLLKN